MLLSLTMPLVTCYATSMKMVMCSVLFCRSQSQYTCAQSLIFCEREPFSLPKYITQYCDEAIGIDENRERIPYRI